MNVTATLPRCQGERFRVFPSCLVTLQPLKVSLGGGEKAGLAEEKHRGTPPYPNSSHLHLTYHLPLRAGCLRTGWVPKTGKSRRQEKRVPRVELLPWSFFDCSGAGGNLSFLGSVDKLEQLERGSRERCPWKVFSLPCNFEVLEHFHLPNRPPENSTLKSTHPDKQYITPNDSILTEGDGSDEVSDDGRIPRRHSPTKDRSVGLLRHLLSPQVSPMLASGAPRRGVRAPSL